jgi:uncharacterized protein (DUF58 family)
MTLHICVSVVIMLLLIINIVSYYISHNHWSLFTIFMCGAAFIANVAVVRMLKGNQNGGNNISSDS